MLKDVEKHHFRLDSYEINNYLCNANGDKRVPTFSGVGILFVFIVKNKNQIIILGGIILWLICQKKVTSNCSTS